MPKLLLIVEINYVCTQLRYYRIFGTQPKERRTTKWGNMLSNIINRVKSVKIQNKIQDV